MPEIIFPPRQTRRAGRRLATGAMLAAAAVCALPALAQTAYPSKPIRLIVSVGAGGATDALTRRLADRLSKSMNTPVYVENQPSGGP